MDSSRQGGGTGGAFGYFPLYSGFMIPFNKKRSSFVGGELQYVHTNKNAIIAFSTFGGYEIFLRANMLNACATAGFGLDPLGKLSFVEEPGIIMGQMKGEMAFAPNYERIDQSHANNMGFHMAAGLNVRFSRTLGMRFRAGQRFLKITESHKNPNGSGYTTFFVNGTDGEKLVVDWSGFFGTVCFDYYF